MRDDICVVVPARGGSKGIPNKNLQEIAPGLTLVDRAVGLARTVTDNVIVSSDSYKILDRFQGVVIDKVDFIDDHETADHRCAEAIKNSPYASCKAMAMCQATSPHTTAEELQRAFSAVLEGKAECAFAAVQLEHNFIWQHMYGSALPLGHPIDSRRRRQDIDYSLWAETGAFYVMNRAFLSRRWRFYGRCVPVEVESGLDIDTQEQLEKAVRVGW